MSPAGATPGAGQALPTAPVDLLLDLPVQPQAPGPAQPAAADSAQPAPPVPPAPPVTDRRGQDRRRGDRRQADRRRSGRLDETWPPGALPAGWGAPTSRLGLDPGTARGEAVSAAAEGWQRILRTYVAARAALGLALVLLPLAAALLVGAAPPLPLLVVSLGYAGQSIALWLVRDPADQATEGPHLPPGVWITTIGADLLAFGLLRLLDPLLPLNLAALLVLPVLMAGVLTPRVSALATAAVATLVLLGGVWLVLPTHTDFLLELSQAGLAGAGLFLVSVLASELSQRLVGQEQIAQRNQALVRQQTQLNSVVIEEMTDGVLVVDRGGRLRAANPAAAVMLGIGLRQLQLPQPLQQLPGLSGLQHTLNQAFALGRWPEALREQLLLRPDGSSRAVQVRARFTKRSGLGADDMPPEDIGVLFLEDMRVVRAQQRQDKLAAMGRVSAGVAHEIRNPLAAIDQANALLLEDPLTPAQARLARMVADNAARLKRIVDDVMAVAPVGDYRAVVLDAAAETHKVCQDWLLTTAGEQQAGQRLAMHLPDGALPVQFDPDHLRRVLVNLLDNALRHASPSAGAVRLELTRTDDPVWARLSVASDGEVVTPEVERHLFEPFYSTRSRGSGLGLYICRELCERHGASIEYLRGPASARHRNEFCLLLRRA